MSSSHDTTNAGPRGSHLPEVAIERNRDDNQDVKSIWKKSDHFIGNFAPVARIMKGSVPDNAKIAKEAKECMQECVSEFISFITSEGQSDLTPSLVTSNSTTAAEKCAQEKRKTVNGEDILFAMTSLGFENYAEALKIYLARYREVSLVSYSLL